MLLSMNVSFECGTHKHGFKYKLYVKTNFHAFSYYLAAILVFKHHLSTAVVKFYFCFKPLPRSYQELSSLDTVPPPLLVLGLGLIVQWYQTVQDVKQFLKNKLENMNLWD